MTAVVVVFVVVFNVYVSARALKLLCEYGVDCTLTDAEHNTPLDFAQRHDHNNCSSYLKSQLKKVAQQRKTNSVQVRPT